jgi:hypothetical protein
MTGTLLDWLTIDRIGIIVGIILGVIALFFKLKGWHTAEEANKIANEAKNIGYAAFRVTLRKDFDSKEIRNAKKNLWAFYRTYSDRIGEEFKKMLDIIDKNENEEEVEKASKIDDARWEYVHLFNRNKEILNYSNDFAKDTIDFGEVELLLIIEPMEKVKAQHLPDGIFHEELFDGFRKKYKKELEEK